MDELQRNLYEQGIHVGRARERADVLATLKATLATIERWLRNAPHSREAVVLHDTIRAQIAQFSAGSHVGAATKAADKNLTPDEQVTNRA